MDERPERRKPGPRPKAEKFIMTSIKLSRELKDQVDAAADAQGMSTAEVVRRALTEWLARHRGGHNGE